MLLIGVRDCYYQPDPTVGSSGFDVLSVGPVSAIEVSFSFKELSRLNHYKKIPSEAEVSIECVGDWDSSQIFNQNGTLRWVTPVITKDEVVQYQVNQLDNVRLFEPIDISAQTASTEVEVNMHTIAGQSWFCPCGLHKTICSTELEARELAKNGWDVNGTY